MYTLAYAYSIWHMQHGRRRGADHENLALEIEFAKVPRRSFFVTYIDSESAFACFPAWNGSERIRIDPSVQRTLKGRGREKKKEMAEAGRAAKLINRDLRALCEPPASLFFLPRSADTREIFYGSRGDRAPAASLFRYSEKREKSIPHMMHRD